MDPVEAQLEAYNARDLERFLACYTDDVVIEDASGEVKTRGLDAIRPMYGDLFTRMRMNAEVRSRLRAGDWVVDDEWVTSLDHPGQPPHHVIVVYHLRDGKIDRVRFLR
ncbi:MAG TPA: nuclear transport factor 2 family protein [Longimicrobium sp.]|nr:nuclear transport factor 2 family protein [Longimicrobium sp.]